MRRRSVASLDYQSGLCADRIPPSLTEMEPRLPHGPSGTRIMQDKSWLIDQKHSTPYDCVQSLHAQPPRSPCFSNPLDRLHAGISANVLLMAEPGRARLAETSARRDRAAYHHIGHDLCTETDALCPATARSPKIVKWKYCVRPGGGIRHNCHSLLVIPLGSFELFAHHPAHA